ncbi:hypothetical protein VSDG_04249 [Cytospora chrysosperma]|uniref:Uncharacterized protein n=1 Tax=Cytospora chrysosperma TaxID=252740 RepID=A0A423W5A2_CYTCH|nr:hypothetical protein VSDG_04249 [Valsa sordida]
MASEREQGDVGKTGTGWDRPHGLLIDTPEVPEVEEKEEEEDDDDDDDARCGMRGRRQRPDRV